MAGRILGITRSILRAEPPSKRATFRAIEPSRQWLDRIEKMELGRRRKRRMPKGAQRGSATAATDGVPAMFRRMKRVCTATTVPQLPPERLPEIAVCGRSASTSLEFILILSERCVSVPLWRTRWHADVVPTPHPP